jgi:Protein of unknown function (DUF3800)
MYFYIDESGHTGANLFDPIQPTLLYGVLSASVNLDVVAESAVIQMRKQLGIERLHASEMGGAGLAKIGESLTQLQRKYNFRFDMYRVQKPDHAIIAFFDQVFDAGNNPAVAWHHYWTPMRYLLLLKLAALFDEPLARMAWDARISLNRAESNGIVVDCCTELIDRLPLVADLRSRDVISRALMWAREHPDALLYNAPDAAAARQIMPNIIGFQSVMLSVAGRLKALGSKRASITVDRQSQFNSAQKSLAEAYGRASGAVSPMGPGMPVIDWRGMPTVPIRIAGGVESVGLELADCILWLFKRVVTEKETPYEVHQLLSKLLKIGKTDEVSLRALEIRWGRWFEGLPEPTEERIANARELLDFAERRRLEAVARAEAEGG